jgi:phosphoglycerate dehydrogenase-like enzyme
MTDAPTPGGRPLRLTMMTAVALDDDVRARLDAVAPGIELHEVHYREGEALRSARSTRTVTDDLRAGAPVLTDDEWEVLHDTDVVVALDVPDALVDRTPSLRWIQLLSAGTEHVDVDACTARGVVVTSGAGLSAGPIAEFVLGRLLQVWKRFREVDAHQEQAAWSLVFGRQLAGHTLGIVGLGAIGRATAVRARALGLRVVATRRSASAGESDPDVDALYTTDGLDAMLAECDVVVLSAAVTPATMNLFDAARFAAMQPGAVLCNVARGALVDEDALLGALRSGHLGAAILDTVRQEPLPPQHPLWRAPNCYLSPHVSSGGTDYRGGLFDLVERNLARFVRGEALLNVVIPATS